MALFDALLITVWIVWNMVINNVTHRRLMLGAFFTWAVSMLGWFRCSTVPIDQLFNML